MDNVQSSLIRMASIVMRKTTETQPTINAVEKKMRVSHDRREEMSAGSHRASRGGIQAGGGGTGLRTGPGGGGGGGEWYLEN